MGAQNCRKMKTEICAAGTIMVALMGLTATEPLPDKLSQSLRRHVSRARDGGSPSLRIALKSSQKAPSRRVADAYPQKRFLVIFDTSTLRRPYGRFPPTPT